MLGGDQYVDIVTAADTMVEAAQQAVGIRRQVQADNVCLLVGDVIQEAGILMGEAIVILLPYVGGQDQVQGSNALAPGQLAANLQPLSMLCNHGVHHADEALVGSKEAVTTGQQVAFQPAFAHMLGQHGVHDAAVVCQEFIARDDGGVPITLGSFEALVQTVGHGLVRSKDAEVFSISIQLEHVADVTAQLDHILLLDRAGERDIHCILLEIGGTQVT